MNWNKLLTALLIAFVAIALSSAAASAKELKIQLVYPETSSVADNTKYFKKLVSEYTDGEVTIKIHYPGQLVKGKEGLTAMQRGMIQGYVGSMLYFSGTIPEVNGEWLPYSWRNVSEAMDIYYNYGYLELMRDAVDDHGAYYVAPISVASMGLMTKFPIRSLDDLKGKKIRAVGMESKIVEALGAASLTISGAEQYSALQRGTVDGTDYPWYTLEDYKFHEVVDYISTPPLHKPGIVEIVLSQDAWNSLSSEQQQAVQEAGWKTAIHSARLGKFNDVDAYKFAKEKGVENIELSQEALSNFKEATAPLYKNHMEDSDLCAKQVEILGEYFQKLGESNHPSVKAIQ